MIEKWKHKYWTILHAKNPEYNNILVHISESEKSPSIEDIGETMEKK